MIFDEQIRLLKFAIDTLYDAQTGWDSRDKEYHSIAEQIEGAERAIESIEELKEIHSHRAMCMCEGCR